MRREIGYTGHLMERELFGEIDKRKHLKEIANKEYGTDKEYTQNVLDTYIKPEVAIASVKRCQTYDNLNPKPKFANELRKRVIELLKPENPSDLKFFTAVQSYNDYKHSTDAFFELNLSSGKLIRVTLNVTYNPNHRRKEEDILFFMPEEGLDPELDKKEYAEKIREVADYVIAKIESKKVNASFL